MDSSDGGKETPSMDTIRTRWAKFKPLMHLIVCFFLFYSGALLTFPFLADLMLNAFCPGELQCSRVVLFMSIMQLACGIGTIFVGPLLGALSDDYGRKPVFLVLTYLAIVPPALLVYSRSQLMTFIWFGFVILVTVLRDGGLLPVALAYVADVAGENARGSGIGYVMAALSSGLFVGTSAALVVRTDWQAFLLAAILQAVAALYATIFVKESNPRKLRLPGSEARTPLLPRPGPLIIRQTSRLAETGKTIWNSRVLWIVATIDFLTSFSMTTLQTFLLYYLKYRLDFGSDEYAILIILAALFLAMGQGIYPLLSSFIGERGTLWIGLLFGSAYYLWYGFGWATWTAYVAAVHCFFLAFVSPALGTLVSKEATKDDQGKVQGYMSGVRSAAGILSPIVMTPLTAGALSENPPFNLPQLPFVICTAAVILAFFFSLALPRLSKNKEDFTKTSKFAIVSPPVPEDIVRGPHTAPDIIKVVHLDDGAQSQTS